MVYFTLADAPRIQTIPFYISNPLRNLALVKDNKDDSSTASSVSDGQTPAPCEGIGCIIR
jgi:hypothetical protein